MERREDGLLGHFATGGFSISFICTDVSEEGSIFWQYFAAITAEWKWYWRKWKCISIDTGLCGDTNSAVGVVGELIDSGRDDSIRVRHYYLDKYICMT